MKPYRVLAFLLTACMIVLSGCRGPSDSTPEDAAAGMQTSGAVVPDVVGKDIRWAAGECESCGIHVTATEVTSDAEPYQVLSQSIAPGEKVEAGMTIVLTYATRPDTLGD